MTDYRYQVGGSLNHQDLSYVERDADAQLERALQEGDFCYVLSSRQMGKSSLLVKTKHQLEQTGFCCTAIDLTGIGSEHINPEQWYKGIISQLYLGFNLIGKVNLKKWWSEQEDITLIQRLDKFITEVLLVTIRDHKLVIFIDEIDSVFSLPFSSDDFFAFIRFCYNQRAIAPEYHRINFAIFGVATPSSLIRNRTRTPFNIGQAIQLTGFSLEQCCSLTRGFKLAPELSKLLLQDILRWTGGQPFLTQKLCKLVAENIIDANYDDNFVNDLVKIKIINNWEAQDDPEHLRTISNRILNSQTTAVRLLGIYQQILLKTSISRDDSLEQIELLLSGLVIHNQGYLQVKNLIYQTIFNFQWVEHQLGLLRPYALQINNWIESHRQDRSQLLQSLSLQQALNWAKDKQLADLDYQYLGASQELAKQQAEYQLNIEQIARKKVEVALEAAQEAHHILAKVKHTARRNHKNFRLSKICLMGIVVNVTIFTALLRFTGWLETAEFSAFDRFMQIHSTRAIEQRVVIIGVDEKDIQKLAEYPISDRILAQAINKLAIDQPRAIGLDIYRDLPVEPGSQELATVFTNIANILGIEKIVNSKVNPPKVLAESKRVGFNDLVLDKDGKVRRAILTYNRGQNKTKYSFALRLALMYLEQLNIKPQTLPNNIHQIKLGKAIFNPLKNNAGSYIRAKTGGYQIMISYHGTQAQFITYSLSDLLTNKIPAQAIQERLILIGVTANSINDFYQTPYSSQKLMPGVLIHANIISQILRAALSGQGLFKVLPEVLEWIWVLIWTLTGALIGWQFKSKLKFAVVVTTAILGLTLVSYQAFLWQWWLPIVPPILALAIAAIVTVLVTVQQKSKMQLRQTIELLLAMSQEQPAAGKIAIEYLKQGESPENLAIIDKLLADHR